MVCINFPVGEVRNRQHVRSRLLHRAFRRAKPLSGCFGVRRFSRARRPQSQRLGVKAESETF